MLIDCGTGDFSKTAQGFLDQPIWVEDAFYSVSVSENGKTVRAKKLDWKPHEKSFSLRELASHLVNILEWVEPSLDLVEMELDHDYKPWVATSVQELLDTFDSGLTKVKEKLSYCNVVSGDAALVEKGMTIHIP